MGLELDSFFPEHHFQSEIEPSHPHESRVDSQLFHWISQQLESRNQTAELIILNAVFEDSAQLNRGKFLQDVGFAFVVLLESLSKDVEVACSFDAA